MTHGEFFRRLLLHCWDVSVNTAYMFGEPGNATIGVQVVLDPHDGPCRAEIVHHEALAGDDAVLEAALRLCREVDPEFG